MKFANERVSEQLIDAEIPLENLLHELVCDHVLDLLLEIVEICLENRFSLKFSSRIDQSGLFLIGK